YQEVKGKRVEVATRFALIDQDTYCFQINGKFDATRQLVIDPNLAWGSYLGGSGSEEGLGIAIDSSDNVWVAGFTGSVDLPGGGFDPSYNGGGDTFVAKIAANGALDWCSYLGGSNSDHGWSIAVDGSGNAWVVGVTTSSDFPGGGFDPSYNGGPEDTFVAKIN